MYELLKSEGLDGELPERILALTREAPEWVSWNDYCEAFELLGERVGVEGIGRAVRACHPRAYAELCAMAGLFQDARAFCRFLNENLMSEMNPCSHAVTESLPDGRMRLVTTLVEGCTSIWFSHGTVALLEIFPMHCGLPEATVEVVSMDERHTSLLVTFPVHKPWASLKNGADAVRREVEAKIVLPPPISNALSPREREVLKLVCHGLTNAEIGECLHTSSATVKNQVSSILQKLGASNRTELAASVTREQ